MKANVITNMSVTMLDSTDDPLAIQWAQRHGAKQQVAHFRNVTDDDVALAQGDLREYDDFMDAREQRESEFVRVVVFAVPHQNKGAYSEAHWIALYNFNAYDRARMREKLLAAGYKVEND